MSVEIRPPLVMRIYAYGFLVLWVVACSLISITALPRATAVIPLGMLAGGGLFCWRIASVAIISEGRTLVVRNLYRTKRIAADDIAEVRTGTPPLQPFGQTVFIVTRGEVVAWDTGSTGRLRRGAERDRAAIEAWLADARGSVAPA